MREELGEPLGEGAAVVGAGKSAVTRPGSAGSGGSGRDARAWKAGFSALRLPGRPGLCRGLLASGVPTAAVRMGSGGAPGSFEGLGVSPWRNRPPRRPPRRATAVSLRLALGWISGQGASRVKAPGGPPSLLPEQAQHMSDDSDIVGA